MHALILLALLQTTPAAEPQAPRPQEAERVAAYVEAVRAADEALAAGDVAAAREGFAHALELSPKSATAAYGLACAAARAGDRDAALDWLGRAVDLGWVDAAVAQWDPDLESLRAETRFGAELERMQRPDTDHTPRWNWKPIACWPAKSCARLAAPTPDGAHVLALLDDGRLQVLDAGTGSLEWQLDAIEARPWALAVAPDGSEVAAVGQDGRLVLVSLADGSTIGPLQGVEATTLGWPFQIHLEWSPDGKRLLVVDADGNAGIWSRAGEPLARWHPQGSECDRRALWAPDGELITAEGKAVQLRDGITAEVVDTLVTCSSPVLTFALSRDGKHLATSQQGPWIVVWDLERRVELARRLWTDPEFPSDDDVPVLAFSPDGERLAWSSREGSWVEVGDATSLKLSWRSEYLGGHFFEAMRVVWSSEGSRLWFAFECGSAGLFTARPGPGRRQVDLAGACVPVFGGGLGATVAVGGAAVVDPITARLRWRRVEVPGGAVVQGPSGHFTGTWASLQSLGVGTCCSEPPPVLESRKVELLFDPKRVRAAQAGVVVAAPAL